MNYRRVVVLNDRATGQECGSIVQDDEGDFHIQEQGTLYPMEALPEIVQRLIIGTGEAFAGLSSHFKPEIKCSAPPTSRTNSNEA